MMIQYYNIFFTIFSGMIVWYEIKDVWFGIVI